MESGFRLPIAREGFPFILIAFVLNVGAYLLGWHSLAATLFLLLIFVISFFRDPERKIASELGDVLSPADGRILSVEEVEQPKYGGVPCQKVVIFMSVFNAHVNRIPLSGEIKDVTYHPGRFLMGFSEKASMENEQNAVTITDKQGRTLVMVQIAGLIARRIICYLKGGESVEQGARFGLIRFGSRVDLYLPQDAEILVVPGDRVKAGLHAIANLA